MGFDPDPRIPNQIRSQHESVLLYGLDLLTLRDTRFSGSGFTTIDAGLDSSTFKSIMANVDDASSRPRQACPAASFYRLRREVGQVSTGARQSVPLPSSSTDDDFEDAGNDSVIEVVPTPRKIPEIDLTSSPLPNAAAPNKSTSSARMSPVATGCKICLESISDIR